MTETNTTPVLTTCPMLGRRIWSRERGISGEETFVQAWQRLFPGVSRVPVGFFSDEYTTYDLLPNGTVYTTDAEGEAIHDGKPLPRGTIVWTGDPADAPDAWERLFGTTIYPSRNRGIERMADGGLAYLCEQDRVYEVSARGAAIYLSPDARSESLPDFFTASAVAQTRDALAKVEAEYGQNARAAWLALQSLAQTVMHAIPGPERAARIAALALFLAYRGSR